MRLKIILLFSLIILFLAALIGGLLTYKKIKLERQRQKETIINAKRAEITIRIQEGWSLKEIGKYLESEKLVKASDFISFTGSYDVSNYSIISQFSKKGSLEGFIFPDTYRIYKPKNEYDLSTAKEILEKTLSNFELKFSEDLETKQKNNGLDFYKMLILASIVEKETGRNAITDEQKNSLFEEKKIVAGIFLNRLKIDMPLQSDATINYITGKNDPMPSNNDLQIKSAYNTYLNAGLPPTPICNPSLLSIKAVLEPTQTDFFYFLHKQPSGEPVYSKTFEEHVKNKLKYLK